MAESPRGLSSMTGFGRASARLEGWELRVESRSVNHERLSLRVDTPEELTWLEPRVVEGLKKRLSRGRVEVGIEVEPAGEGDSARFDRIDDERFAAVAREFDRLAGDCGLARPVAVRDLAEYRDFFERSTGEIFPEEEADRLMEVVDRALDELVASRRTEGEGIAGDLRRLLSEMSEGLEEVERLRNQSRDRHRSRVESRLRETLAEFDLEEIDDSRVAEEVAYYVEKGDIAEEIQRTRSHVETLGELVEEPPGPAVGKKIDFYLQELVRETNTMSSKSRHPGLTDCIIEMKSLVEKMREQAANVQ